jgi:hypothetical protein
VFQWLMVIAQAALVVVVVLLFATHVVHAMRDPF